MLWHLDPNFKVENFKKCLIKVKELDCQGYLSIYNNLLALCIDNGILLLLLHLFNPDCAKPIDFLFAKSFDDPHSQVHSTHAYILKT